MALTKDNEFTIKCKLRKILTEAITYKYQYSHQSKTNTMYIRDIQLMLLNLFDTSGIKDEMIAYANSVLGECITIANRTAASQLKHSYDATDFLSTLNLDYILSEQFIDDLESSDTEDTAEQ